jgi:hypothetical protein
MSKHKFDTSNRAPDTKAPVRILTELAVTALGESLASPLTAGYRSRGR